MINIQPEDAIRAADDEDYAESLARSIQPIAIATLFEWVEDKGFEHGNGTCDGAVCPDCKQYTAYTARARYVFADSGEYMCLSIECIKRAAMIIGQYYKLVDELSKGG